MRSSEEEDLLEGGRALHTGEGREDITANSTADPGGEDIQSSIPLHCDLIKEGHSDSFCTSSSELEPIHTPLLPESIIDDFPNNANRQVGGDNDPETSPSIGPQDQLLGSQHEQIGAQSIKKRKQQSVSALPLVTKYIPPAVEPINPYNNTSNNDQPVVVLGVDISRFSPLVQFLICASGVFGFNLTYGFLQEFLTVEICNRELGLFLAMMQFTGYTVWSYVLRNFSNRHQRSGNNSSNEKSSKTSSKQLQQFADKETSSNTIIHSYNTVPTRIFLVMGLLSAIDMAMTNMALHYINYPAKTLMKSCRVIFTMFFGIILVGKQYRMVDYLVVVGLVAGLAVFIQADAASSATFEPIGIFMLTISLLCDGATNIMSESTMKNYGIGQDELIFRMFSLALIAVTMAATFNGDLYLGLKWLFRPGTYDEWKENLNPDEITWSVPGKIAMIVLFSSMGFFGSSCSAAITKNFGALAMSMTSTARRAATLFISFFMFDNECTYKHVAGVIIFIVALSTKSCASRS